MSFPKAPHELSGMPPDTPILIALSGGADSRLLLDYLIGYAKEYHTPLTVAHVDHGIRGEASARDREFCRALAGEAGLPFFLLSADIPALAAEHRRGIEEEARMVRYDFFEKIMRERGIPLLATAHNATDNAETLLFRLSRGSGLKGACGIPPVREFAGGKIIRPLLGLEKAEILALCEKKGLAYVTDESNADTTYARNLIRHEILPRLGNISEGAVRNLCRFADNARRDEDLLSSLADDYLTDHPAQGGLPVDSLTALHPAVSTRVLKAVFGNKAEETHIDAALVLARRAIPHSSLSLPLGRCAVIENGRLFCRTELETSTAPYEIKLLPGLTPLSGCDMLLRIESPDAPWKPTEEEKTLLNVYKKSTTTTLRFDRIEDSFLARSRREGDTILVGGMNKKVKKLLCDAKVPLSLRSRIPFVCSREGEILWIPFVAARDGTGIRELTLTLYYNE